jgi:hypothetical protein
MIEYWLYSPRLMKMYHLHLQMAQLVAILWRGIASVTFMYEQNLDIQPII